ncbi:CinA family protein [Tepidicaulis sp.]|uniref:CinA family protein n=1 Tax=Tepidicaulis sp. TaxID=1920809 RepID=UPI003B59D9DB
MDELRDLAGRAGTLLKARGERLAVTESTCGGLLSAALVAQPGASGFYLGGAVIYTREAGRALYRLEGAPLKGKSPLTEDYIAAIAEGFRGQMGADWALGEMGAAGPDPSPYGPPAGTAAIALAGPSPAARIVSTGVATRAENMRLFAKAALELLIEGLEGA